MNKIDDVIFSMCHVYHGTATLLLQCQQSSPVDQQCTDQARSEQKISYMYMYNSNQYVFALYSYMCSI